MTSLKDKIIEAGITDHVFTNIDIDGLLDGTPASRYGIVNKATKKGELIKLRRGLYLLAEKYRHNKLSKFFLANQIVPQSYISLESGLSYHGWIPEHVATVTSIIPNGRSRKFATSFGEFAFYQLPTNEYEFLTSVIRTEEIKGEPFFIASPLRALTDFVYIRKINWEGLNYLTTGLRIDIAQLMQITPNDFLEIKKIYRSKRVLQFLNHLQKELKKQ